MSEPIKLVAFCGSLRKASFNRMALNVFAGKLPAGCTMETIEIRDCPPPAAHGPGRRRFLEGVFAAGATCAISAMFGLDGCLPGDHDRSTSPRAQPGRPVAPDPAVPQDWGAVVPDFVTETKVAVVVCTNRLESEADLQRNLRWAAACARYFRHELPSDIRLELVFDVRGQRPPREYFDRLSRAVAPNAKVRVVMKKG